MASSGRFSACRFPVSCFRVAWFAFCRLHGLRPCRTDGTMPIDLFVVGYWRHSGKRSENPFCLSTGSPNGRFFLLSSNSSRVILKVGYHRLAAASLVSSCCWFRLLFFVVPVCALFCVLGFWWCFVSPRCYFFGFCFLGGWAWGLIRLIKCSLC